MKRERKYIMLSKRIQSLQPSPTLALTALAGRLKAEGYDVINLSAGEPDWSTYKNVAHAGIQAIKNDFTKYTPASGIPELRKVIAESTQKHLNIEYTPEQVTVSTGSKFVLFAALQSVIDEGDKVIVPSPYWVSYPEMIRLAGGEPTIASTTAENHFKLTADQLKQALTPQTKVLLLNSPSNPTGQSYSQEELKALALVLQDFPNVLIFSDDIYNQLFFEGLDYAPHILEVAPQLQDRTLILNGLSKTYGMTGWRIGWGVGPKVLIKAMSSFQSQSVSCPTSFCQKAAIEAITNTSSQVKETVLELKERRDFAHKLFNDLPKLNCDLPSGGLYLWINIEQLLNTRNGFKSSRDFSQKLLESEKVALVPGIEFGQEGYVRIIYAIDQDKMLEASNRIKTLALML